MLLTQTHQQPLVISFVSLETQKLILSIASYIPYWENTYFLLFPEYSIT